MAWVEYSKAGVPKPIVDGKVVPIEPNLHPAVADAIWRAGRGVERSLDPLIRLAEELVELAGQDLSASSRTCLEQDVRRAVEEHEASCWRAIYWSKVMADME